MSAVLRICFVLAVLLLQTSWIQAAEPRVIASNEEGVILEVNGLDHVLSQPEIGGPSRLSLPGGVILPEPGRPAVPVVPTLIGIPLDVTVTIETLDAQFLDLNNVTLGAADPEWSLPIESTVYPVEASRITRIGMIRDQRVAGLVLNPLRYDPATRTLQVATRLRVRVRFDRDANTRPTSRRPFREPGFDRFYDAQILNASQASPWRVRQTPRPKQSKFWYDPNDDWYRVAITADGMYRLDADWFLASSIPVSSIDPATLQVFVEGEEIPLLVSDGGDGKIDPGDEVLFWGMYRRESDRDTESRFGRTRTHWLRFGREIGKRYVDTDGAPTDLEPVTVSLRTVHAEKDSVYERLGEAPDVNRDHWFDARTASPSSVGGQEFPVVKQIPLQGLEAMSTIESTIQVGMHGISLRDEIEMDHLTRVEIGDGILVTEDRWDGQVAFTAEGTVTANRLTDTLTVTLRSPGSPEFPLEPVPYVDHVRLNWITVTYPHRLEAESGLETFKSERTANYKVTGFSAEPVILNRSDGTRVTGAVLDKNGDYVAVTFASTAGDLVAVEPAAYLTPQLGELDSPSTLRTDVSGASYVIVTDSLFLSQGEQLAEHRRLRGLTSIVVDVQDIYDEFAFGDVSDRSVWDFTQHAFDTWVDRPVYLMLFGRMTYDYRNILDQFKNTRVPRVPAMPFQSVRRGQAFTDHFYGMVSGDDPFMDIWVGRISVNHAVEADAVVAKILSYDEAPQAAWRSRATFLANWDAIAGDALFIQDSDKLIENYADPLGLQSFRVYHDVDTPPEPNESSNETIQQLNEGRVLLNFMGHGSAALMQKFIAGTFQQRGFNYIAQLTNAERLPLVIAMSCLNGLYDEPTLICFAEEMVNKRDGGAIAYVSASSLAFIFVNNEINKSMLQYLLLEGVTDFGRALALSKTDLLAAMPGIDNGVFMMNLMGDPAQHLAIPDGPDYVVETDDLQVIGGADVLATSDTARVTVRIRNEGIISGGPLEVLVIDRNLDTGTQDTIGTTTLSPFGPLDSTAVLWPLAGRTGRHQVDVMLDPSGQIAEIRTDNNQAAIDVEVFGRLSAVSAFPIESQEVVSPVRLGVRAGIATMGTTLGEIEVSRSIEFDKATIQSGSLTALNGFAIWETSALEKGVWFWRARMSDGKEAGAWTQPRSFTIGSPAVGRSVAWRQSGVEALRIGESDGVVVYGDGTVGRTTDLLPLSITAEFRETSITAEDVPATAILATDGTFHYVKGFFSSPPIYPDSETFIKVGSGLNGTNPGENLGPISDPEIPTVSATYHGDGFIYADNMRSKEILRISPSTGETVSIPVEAGLLEVRTGLVFDGHSMLTSDGNLIYNVANGINGIRRAGWDVRVFDPENDWAVVREFEVGPTSTGFAFGFTDGVIADGEYLYLIEFSTGSSHRVRVVSAKDGSLVDEYQSDQGETDLLSGQYDWVNNKVWLGQLGGNQIHRYTGRRLPDEGILISAPIGPASSWNSVSVDVSGLVGEASARVDLLGETDADTFLPIAEWSNFAPGAIDLTELDTSIDRIQVRLRLSAPGLDRTASLASWSASYQPVTDVAISNLESSATEVVELEPVLLSVDVVNRGPIDLALGAAVAFYTGDPDAGGRIIGRQAVPEDTRIGVLRRVEFAWITARFAGTHRVHARVEDLFGNVAFFRSSLQAENVIEIQSSTDVGLPGIEITALDASGDVRSGDYLPADPDFRVTISDSSGVDRATVQIQLISPDANRPDDGVGSNLVSEVAETPTQLSFLYKSPVLNDGTHALAIQATDRIGNGPASKTLSFQVTSDLQVESVLNYPNPMADKTHFTFVLSRPSEVTIKVYTLVGRLIRVITERTARAGYNQIAWDGQDSKGRVIANGTYIYTVMADDGEKRVRKKETLIVYR
jgi:hypothetical protein